MIYSISEKTISGVYVSPGSAETLVKRRGITNHYLTAYSLSNISAKNYQNWLMCVEVIVCNISVVFLRHSVFESMHHCDVGTTSVSISVIFNFIYKMYSFFS